MAYEVGIQSNLIIFKGQFKLSMREEDELGVCQQQKWGEGPEISRKMGLWSSQEQQKYIKFLSLNRKSLQSRQLRKNAKIFKLMAQFVTTRDGIQCRSHHIKQLRTHKQIRRIIDFHSASSPFLSEQKEALLAATIAEKSQRQEFDGKPGQPSNKNGQRLCYETNLSCKPSSNGGESQNQFFYQFFSQFPLHYSPCVPMFFIPGIYSFGGLAIGN